MIEEMIEENGHVWAGRGDNRCCRCSIKHRQYLEIKAASERPDESEEYRSIMREGLKCPG